MARLPVPGSDDGTWGDILNDFLSQSHNPDGTLQSVAIPDGSVTPAKLSQSYVPASEKGSANGIATLDATGKVPAAQLPPAGSTPDATTTSKGVVQLAGDLSGTATAPTVPGLVGKADDSTVVHMAGTETITGAKDFTGGVTVNGTNVVVGTDTRLTDQRVPTDGSVTDAKVSATANIAQSKIANLTTDLAGKASAAHAHAIADVTNLQTSLDAKASATDPRFTDQRTPTDNSVTTAKIVDGSITEPKLDAANTPSNGQVLSWNGTNFSWITPSSSTGYVQGDGIAKITVGATAPTGPAVGDVWIST